MSKLNIISLLLFATLAYTCSKDEDSITYFQAIVNGEKVLLTDVEATYSQVTLTGASGSMDVLSVYGIRSDYKKNIILDLETLHLSAGEYVFTTTTDSVFLVKATYKQDNSFYCTAYNSYLLNPGKLVITKIGNDYIKGHFEFNATHKDIPDSVISITNGSFFAKIR
jgi:hypothetical protein